MRHVIVGIDSLIHFVRLAGLNHSSSGSPQLARQIAVFCRFTALAIHQPRAWPARTTTLGLHLLRWSVFTAQRYVIAVYAMARRPSICPSVKKVFYWICCLYHHAI